MRLQADSTARPSSTTYCSVRRALVSFAVSFAATQPLLPRPAAAWCGERFPSWAYYLKWDQQTIPFEHNGQTSAVEYRVVGDQVREKKAGVPPIMVVGTPGVGYEYLENLEALSVSDRRIVEVTFPGTSGEKNAPPELRTADALAAALLAVCVGLQLPAVHLVAHGLGAPPALRLAAASSVDGAAGLVHVRSLALVSPYGALSDLRASAQANVAGVTSATATKDGSVVVASRLASALLPTVSGNARGSCIAEALAHSSDGGAALLLQQLLSAPLGGGDLARRIDAVTSRGVPVLLSTAGTADLVSEEALELTPSATVARVVASGHMPFIEQRDEFLLALLNFFDKADGTETNREFKFGDPLETLKELT